jgi:hypothetical protein
LPVWFKAVATPVFPPDFYDWQRGDVIVHTTDPNNGVGGGTANVAWTSPIEGVIDIDGGIWQARDIGRSNHWTLLSNSTILAEGDLFDGDAYDRNTPFAFSVSDLAVVAGDVLALYIERTGSAPGEFVGVTLDIAAEAVPEPRSLIAWIPIGFALMAGISKRHSQESLN